MGKTYFADPAWIGNPGYLNRGLERSEQADLALELIARWGTVAAAAGPEDSSGRATTVLQTPEELVERACRVAELTFEALEQREWIRPAPVTPEELCTQAGYHKALAENAEYEHDQRFRDLRNEAREARRADKATREA